MPAIRLRERERRIQSRTYLVCRTQLMLAVRAFPRLRYLESVAKLRRVEGNRRRSVSAGPVAPRLSKLLSPKAQPGGVNSFPTPTKV